MLNFFSSRRIFTGVKLSIILLSFLVSNLSYAIPTHQVANQNKVVVYGTTWCGFCKKARQFLTTAKVEFTDYDIESSVEAREQYEKLHGKGVPLIFVGEQRIDGFNESKLHEALKAHHLIN